MFECTYTKDKLKKAKIWVDGYITITGTTVTLYNEDKKRIYTSKYKYLASELVLPAYIIYCEKITEPHEENICNEECEREETKHENKKVQNYKKIQQNTVKSINNYKQKEKITEDGIILLEEDENEWKKVKTNDNKKKKVLVRSNNEILEMIRSITEK